MFSVFRAITDRLKAMFLANVGLDLEADLLARNAERRAELFRQADRYDAEGLKTVAQQLRQQAEAISLQQPLSSILPAVAHLQEMDSGKSPTLLPFAPNSSSSNQVNPQQQLSPISRKKGR